MRMLALTYLRSQSKKCRDGVLSSCRTTSTLGWDPWATVVFRVPRPLAWLFVAAAMFATPDEGLAQMPDLSGNWIRGGRLEFGEWSLTDEGRRGLEAYDFKTDDPAYRCLAASWARAWMNPNVVVRITQSAKEVRFQHEFMDIDRRLPIVEAAQANPPRVSIQGQPALGSSTAWYDGDSLVIETTDVGPGYVSTMQEWAGSASESAHANGGAVAPVWRPPDH